MTFAHGDVSRPTRVGLVLCVSALTLTLQLVHSRILAFQFWHHLVYFVITMGFLGFAASGTCLAVSRRVNDLPARDFFAMCLAGIALGIFGSRLVLAALPNEEFAFLELGNLLSATAAYTALMIPYFFGGLLVGGALRREPAAAGTLYLASLAGSALGCLLFVVLVVPLGAPGLLAVLFAAAAGSALRLARPGRIPVALGSVAAGVAAVLTILLPVVPDRGKQYWLYTGPHDFTEWNPISRIDVLSSPKRPWVKYILIDGDAQAPMFLYAPSLPGIPPVMDTAHRQVLYALREPGTLERVLVIGAGGGADVLTAKRSGVRHVDAVEINPTTARIVRGRFAAFTGDLFLRDGVTLYNEDGRSFAARTSNRYDAVVLFAVDSLAASSTGAYVLMENYLYTLEAFARYWELLTDRGVLQISRWYYPEAPRETLRVFSQAHEALRRQGVRDPGRHVAVVADLPHGKSPFANVLVSKHPLTRADAFALSRFCEANGFEIIYLPRGLVPDERLRPTVFTEFADAFAAFRADTFYAAYRFNVTPVSDDNPFFFSYRRWSDLVPSLSLPSVKYYDNIIGARPLILLIVLVLQTTLLVLALVLWPVLRARDRKTVGWTDSAVLVFFALIGIGFMFIEIPLIQRFVLLLGHPTYSMSVSLPAILLGAAAGSYLSAHLRQTPVTRVAIASLGINMALITLHVGRAWLDGAALAWPIAGRIAAVILIAGALGVLMGIPFPTVVATLEGRRHLISLGWTVNAGTTVIASVLAIPIAMNWGFPVVLAIAGVCYMMAWLSIALWCLARRHGA